MTPADKRMLELLDKWLTSLELHLKYADLGEAAYAAVQPWPKHDRPTRWIIELAKQKTLDLKSQQESRIAMGDGKFAEALELMGFLANLVGSQHVQRFIPLAETDKEQKLPPTDTATMAIPPASRRPAKSAARETDATREMPRLPVETRKPEPPPAPKQTATQARAPAKPAKKAATAPASGAKTAPGPALQKKIMADAVRLLKWGKEWHELADLIARIADRPPAGEIRRILRAHKTEIELQAEGDD